MRQHGFLSGLAKKMGQGASALEPLDGPPTEEALRAWLVRRIAQQVELDPAEIDTAARFDSYGLDSIVAVTISGDIEKLLKKELSPALLFEYATIDELAKHLADTCSPEPAGGLS